MKYVVRSIQPNLFQSIPANKVLVLLGARRVGKTQLIEKELTQLNEPYLYFNGEDVSTVAIFETRTIANYKRLMGEKRFLVIDEAQTIPDIGKILKLMVDNIEGIRIVVTGSSVFDLENKLGEPLTGRSIRKQLFPMAQMELNNIENLVETHSHLEERLRFGSYPELLRYQTETEKKDYLNDLVSSYLLRDILSFEGLKKPDKLIKLLRLIAYQIGQEVSLPELGSQLGIDKATVERYLDLLSKVFVIQKVEAFSRNPRKEISKSSRWYFLDNGIRNALIANFNTLDLRNDQGQLWENYLFTERMKFQNYTKMTVNNYFWRSYTQQEVDFVEERGGTIYGYEFKWNDKKKAKTPSLWESLYPEAQFEHINPKNYLDFIS